MYNRAAATLYGMNIIFFGTSNFAKIILDQLVAKDYKPILVVTTPDKPIGRKQAITSPPVKVLAKQHNISVIQPEKLSKSNPDSFGQDIDLIIVAAYGKIIPKRILDIPKYGALNVHPSLLPKWRGPSPIQYAILNGDKETGVTIMLMDEQVDHGDIVSNMKHTVSSGMTTDKLSQELASLGAGLLVETIPKWIAGKIKPREQDHKKATYSKIIKKEDGRICWSKSAKDIERQVRAFVPWPGSFFFWNNRRIEVTKGYDADSAKGKKRGEAFAMSADVLGVQTAQGVFIIEKLKLEGKNEITAKQFLNGYGDIIGATLD